MSELKSVTHSIKIAGSIDAVFDFVNSARFWPEWHPAAQLVRGVTQRPFHLGDVIYERGQFAGTTFDMAWRVIEHVRPTRAVLYTDSPLHRITYTFQAIDEGVLFSRELAYDDAPFQGKFASSEELEAAMHAKSTAALQRLKELVERLVREEAGALDCIQEEQRGKASGS